MPQTISPFQRSSVMVSLALNVVLILAISLPLLSIETNTAKTRYCVQTSTPVSSPDLAQSGKIQPNTVSPFVQLPARVVRKSTLPKPARPAAVQVSFVRCVPRNASLGG